MCWISVLVRLFEGAWKRHVRVYFSAKQRTHEISFIAAHAWSLWRTWLFTTQGGVKAAMIISQGTGTTLMFTCIASSLLSISNCIFCLIYLLPSVSLLLLTTLLFSLFLCSSFYKWHYLCISHSYPQRKDATVTSSIEALWIRAHYWQLWGMGSNV